MTVLVITPSRGAANDSEAAGCENPLSIGDWLSAMITGRTGKIAGRSWFKLWLR